MIKTAATFTTAVALSALTTSLPAGAGDAEAWEIQADQRVIALQTHDFELQETDISHLGVGDAETIVTNDGRSIDILRTTEGVEVYLDGDLVAPALHEHGGLHGDYEILHKRVEVICGDEDECEKSVRVSDEDMALDDLHGGHEPHVIVIRKERTVDG